MKSLMVVDTGTGEILREYQTDAVIVIPVSQRRLHWRRWFMGFQDFFIRIAEDRELTLADRRVFDYLLGIMDLDNYVSVPQTEIARRLGVSVRTVQRAIEKLQKKNILIVKRVGKYNAYMLNPEAVWKGKIRDYKSKLIEFRRLP